MGKYNAIDLFCGCGGLSYGFELAGFDILLGIDRKEVLLEVESGLMDAIIDKFGTDVDVLELHEKVLSYDEAVEAL